MRYVFEAARPILIDLLSTIVFFILLWTTHDFILATALVAVALGACRREVEHTPMKLGAEAPAAAQAAR